MGLGCFHILAIVNNAVRYIYIYIILSGKKGCNFAICYNMDRFWGFFMLIEIRWNANNAWFHSYVEYKKQGEIGKEDQCMLMNRN